MIPLIVYLCTDWEFRGRTSWAEDICCIYSAVRIYNKLMNLLLDHILITFRVQEVEHDIREFVATMARFYFTALFSMVYNKVR